MRERADETGRLSAGFVLGAFGAAWGYAQLFGAPAVAITTNILALVASGVIVGVGAIGFPPEVLPMAIIRPLTGSGSAAIVVDMIDQFGEDSILVKIAGTMFGSTETTFYVIAVYFGAVNVKKTRHAVPAGLLADFTAMLLAVYIVQLVF